jgi:dipeptidyl aminopeptidase/acylaminoacyl peptidase
MDGDGATPGNIQRGLHTRALLRCIPEVALDRVGAHGHSMGAFMTGALAGSAPGAFRAASHTAGGVADTGAEAKGVFTTTVAQTKRIRAPYQIHHGVDDVVVPIALGRRMIEILRGTSVTSEAHEYPGVGHSDIPRHPMVLERVRKWHTDHGVL